jgi:hypothetical protein
VVGVHCLSLRSAQCAKKTLNPNSAVAIEKILVAGKVIIDSHFEHDDILRLSLVSTAAQFDPPHISN